MKYYIGLLFLLVTLCLKGQNLNIEALKDSITVLSKKIQVLEVDKEKLKPVIDTIEVLRNPKDYLLQWGLLGLILFGLGFLLWKKIPELITTHLSNHKEKFDRTTQLKKDKRILVLSHDVLKPDDFIRKFFAIKGFDKVTYEVINSEGISQIDCDIVFAYNEDGKLNQDDICNYVKNDDLLFYFGATNTWAFPNKNETPTELQRFILARANFANSKAQIYGNLISSLEYHDMVAPQIYLLTLTNR